MTTSTQFWEAVRVEQAHEWKQRNDWTYFWASKTKGAADCAWMTALRAKSAYNGEGFCAAGSVQDLQKNKRTHKFRAYLAGRQKDGIPHFPAVDARGGSHGRPPLAGKRRANRFQIRGCVSTHESPRHARQVCRHQAVRWTVRVHRRSVRPVVREGSA